MNKRDRTHYVIYFESWVPRSQSCEVVISVKVKE